MRLSGTTEKGLLQVSGSFNRKSPGTAERIKLRYYPSIISRKVVFSSAAQIAFLVRKAWEQLHKNSCVLHGN